VRSVGCAVALKSISGNQPNPKKDRWIKFRGRPALRAKSENSIMSEEQNNVLDETTIDSTPPRPLDRETLYKLVWSEPMLKVAARYDVSSSYLARICTRMNVPRPERGYWAKLAVGRAPKQPPLPEPEPGDELAWAREGEEAPVKRLTLAHQQENAKTK